MYGNPKDCWTRHGSPICLIDTLGFRVYSNAYLSLIGTAVNPVLVSSSWVGYASHLSNDNLKRLLKLIDLHKQAKQAKLLYSGSRVNKSQMD